MSVFLSFSVCGGFGGEWRGMEGTYQPPSGGSNGYHHGGSTQSSRFRKGTRSNSRLRDHPVDTASRVPGHQQQQQETTDAPPCTDFDMAYFQSYSHVGIHEEMIKVLLLLEG